MPPVETLYQSRAPGALIGLLVGDCLGSLFDERSTSRSQTQVRRTLWGSDGLRHSGITIQTLAIANALIATSPHDALRQSTVAAELTAAHALHRDVEYRPTIDALLRELQAGADWEALAPRQLGGLGNWGSGAAARSVPIGIVSTSRDSAAAMSRDQAKVTHTHPAAVEAAAAAAMITQLAVRLPPKRFFHTRKLIGQLRACVDWPPLDDALLRIVTLPDHDPRTIACRIGGAQDAISAVAVALSATIGGDGHFERSLHIALGTGGDTRSAAALTGALAGGLSGIKAIPETWTARCPMVPEFARLARSLMERNTPHPSSSTDSSSHQALGEHSVEAH